MENSKKIAAAISAVMDYIKTEEEIVCMQAAPCAPQPPQVALAPPKLWGISGRQAMTFVRYLRQAQILILEILRVFLWLKFSLSLISNKIEHFETCSDSNN
ncbi:MAG: hypothetical protein JRI92_07460 [Deltaproteobacteria bacterium]|nr:hypothetical protein [Deltaproteobacteria bacterium]